MHVLISKHFVRDPIEHIENEEAEGEDGSWDGVDPLCSFHEAAADIKQNVAGRQACKHGRSLRERPIPRQTAVHPVSREVQVLILGG